MSTEAYLEWWDSYASWRDETAASLNLSAYDNEALQWARTSFIQPQLMIHDKFLYDRESGSWTVDKYIDDVVARYGGIDSVLLWPTYPNIGVDDRNQYDMHYSCPGGIEGLTQLVADFHAKGVKVLWPYNPWDQYTRNTEVDDMYSLVDLIVTTNAEGFNGDTMDGVNASFYDESIARDHPIVIEPETMKNNVPLVATNVWSWSYWSYQTAPLVSTYKSLTGGRHLTHICERWATLRTDGLQHAFFNGAGYESWENVWGIWNQITERDSAALLRTATILRYLGDFVQGGSKWMPHLPIAPVESNVYASKFYNGTHSVFLIVNRDGPSVTRRQSSDDYTKFVGTNCYAKHGATDLESPQGSSAGSMELSACEALCDDTDGCTAVVWDATTSNCYRRSDVELSSCYTDQKYDLYAKEWGPSDSVELTLPCGLPPSAATAAAAALEPSTFSYTSLGAMNCYEGHGAADLESPTGSSAGAMSLDECHSLCDATDSCTGVVYSGAGECYRRSDLFTPLCDASTEVSLNQYVTYSRDVVPTLYWTDLYGGRAVDEAATCNASTGVGTITLSVEPGGYGALMVSTAERDEATESIMATMADITSTPLHALSPEWEPLPQVMINTSTMAVKSPGPGSMAPQAGPETIVVEGTSAYEFSVSGNCIEGDNLPSAVDVQFPWEDHPQRWHSPHNVSIPTMRVHKYPITNADYAAFLEATGWAPVDGQNWLGHWNGEPTYPEGAGAQPVTWVSVGDAAAYCDSLGMRLPTSYEWQYIAQGGEPGRAFPWGDEKDASRVPEFTTGRSMPDPDDVTAHPEGASAFGVEDLVGNVYQWTSVFEDEHTAHAVIRGSSRWRPDGSDWYLPEPKDLTVHGTFLLVADGLDRSAGIGFRCVGDV